MAAAYKWIGSVTGIGKVLGLLVLVIGLGFLAGPPSASAQQLGAAEKAALQKQKDELFQRMLQDPANLDVTFAYANVAAKLGDYEGAVSALDRMLLFNPNLPRVQLELGALYFRMGSYDIARDYFDKAAAANPPPEVKARIAEYQAQIKKATSTSQLSGYLFLGLQYQSDANVAPGSPLVHSPIGDILLNNQFIKQRDENLFANGSILYNYDLGTQNRDSLEITGVGFMNHYFRFDRFDLDLGEVTMGPRLNFPSGGLFGSQPASAKPYVILNEVGLGENQYFYTYGVGVQYEEPVWKDIALKETFEFRQKKFSNAPDRPLSTGLDGSDKLVSLQLTKPVTENSVVSFEFDYLNQSTRLGYYGNDTYALSGSYSLRYHDPMGITANPWQTTFFLSRSWSLYDAPDPCCNTSGSAVFFSPSTRDDRHWRFGFTHAVIVSPSLALVLQVQRDIVSSNLSLYGYTSDSVVVGPQLRF